MSMKMCIHSLAILLILFSPLACQKKSNSGGGGATTAKLCSQRSSPECSQVIAGESFRCTLDAAGNCSDSTNQTGTPGQSNQGCSYQTTQAACVATYNCNWTISGCVEGTGGGISNTVNPLCTNATTSSACTINASTCCWAISVSRCLTTNTTEATQYCYNSGGSGTLPPWVDPNSIGGGTSPFLGGGDLGSLLKIGFLTGAGSGALNAIANGGGIIMGALQGGLAGISTFIGGAGGGLLGNGGILGGISNSNNNATKNCTLYTTQQQCMSVFGCKWTGLACSN